MMTPMRAVHTIRDVPKKGATRREPVISRTMTPAPHRKEVASSSPKPRHVGRGGSTVPIFFKVKGNASFLSLSFSGSTPLSTGGSCPVDFRFLAFMNDQTHYQNPSS